jgi:hypothetical protein
VAQKRIYELTENTAPDTAYCLPIDKSGAASAERVTIANLLQNVTQNTPMQIAALLQAADAADSDNFGDAVALSANGAVLAVGASAWEGASGTDRGGVYIYDWNGAAWVQRGSVLEASDAADSDNYGDAVALSADGAILAVGAPVWEGASGTNRGGVYIYDWNGAAWVQRGSVLEASDAADNDRFGAAVALSANGAVLAVGANQWEGASGSTRGGVYIYDWNGAAWVQRGSVLEASDAEDNDRFGRSVALAVDGAVLAVGASAWEGASGTDRGGVYIYDWNGAAWVQRGSVLEASDAADSDEFGRGLALSADGAILAVGASAWEGASGTDRGGVYLYSLAAGARPFGSQPNGAGWASPAAGVLAANVGGVERQRIDSSGDHVANGVFAALGDARASRRVVRRAISSHTDTTWYTLFTDGASGLLSIPTDTLWQFRVMVVGLTSGAPQRWAYTVTGAIVNDGGSTSLVGTPTVTVISESDAAYDCQVVADDANDALLIQVRRNGGSSYNVRWVASVELAAVTYP